MVLHFDKLGGKKSAVATRRIKSIPESYPIFLGLILGEFTVGSLWTIIGIVRNVSTYGFWF